MKCRECGTEIAEKALICFRCGASVQEPITKPYVHDKKTSRPLIAGIILVLVILLALVLFFLERAPV